MPASLTLLGAVGATGGMLSQGGPPPLAFLRTAPVWRKYKISLNFSHNADHKYIVYAYLLQPLTGSHGAH